MEVLIEHDGSCRRLRLVGEMTIYEAEADKGALLEAAAHTDVELDLSGIGEIDSAGLQILLLLRREALAAGSGLRFTAQSAAVRELVGLFRLEATVGEGCSTRDEYAAAEKLS